MSAKYEFIDAEKASHAIIDMCAWLHVSRSGYCDWRSRVPAENLVRAGQAACSYSLRIPPSRCLLRMFRWAISSESTIGGGNGLNGRALVMP